MAPGERALRTSVFFLCAALLLTLWSWEGSPLNHDEITYLVMAKTMVDSGNWLDLNFYDATVHQRPPLAIWLLAASGAIGNFSLFATRLPAMLMAFATLCFLTLAVRRLTRDRSDAALLAAALLLATPLFYFNARRPMTDTTFLAGAVAFIWAYLASRKSPRMWLAAGVAGGWMLMSKGVVSALPLTAVGLHLLLTQRRKELAQPWIWTGVAMALALATPWHLAQTIRHGTSFWHEYIGFNVLQRAGQALFQETRPTFYLEDLWHNSPFLTLAMAAGIIHSLGQLWLHRPAAPERRSETASNHLFVLLWFAAAAIPMSTASTRIEHYFLPSLPPLAAAAAMGLADHLNKRPMLHWAAMAAVLLLFFSGNSLHLFAPDYSPDQTRFAQLISNSNTRRTIALNHYELALFYTLDEPVDMRTTDQRFFDVVDSAPILHRTNGVSLLSPAALLSEIQAQPTHVITAPHSLPLLCGTDSQRCTPEGPFQVIQGDYLLLVSPR